MQVQVSNREAFLELQSKLVDTSRLLSQVMSKLQFMESQPHLSLSSVASIQSIIPIEYRIENGFKKNKQRAS